jgi:hypothetical protein
MGLFRRKVPSHLIRIHPDNATSKDWVILLEAGTIIGPRLKDFVLPEQRKNEKLQQNTMFGFERSISSLWRDMIHEFTPYIFVLNFPGIRRAAIAGPVRDVSKHRMQP